MFKKIAVPLDGSALAEKALPFAIGLANRLNATLLLLRVTHLAGIVVDTVDRELESLERAETYLDDLKRTITDPGWSNSLEAEQVEAVVVYGETAPELIEMTPFEKADLLVMTTHGRTGIGRLLLGSVANKVLRQSKLPVLLIKPEKPKTSPFLEVTLTESNYFSGPENKILVTLDGTPEAEAILESAIQMAKETKATLHLLAVVLPFTPVDFGGGYYSYGVNLTDDTERRAAEANQYLEHIQKRLFQQGVQTTALVKIGNPTEEIMIYAGEIKAGMLAIASAARSTVGKFFLGSVTDEVLRKSHLPILMVHSTAPVKEMSDREILEKHSTSKV